MPSNHTIPRRRALQWISAGLGASAMNSSLALASVNKDAESPRLVVIMLRGALDGLAAVPALGDPAWSSLRGHEATNTDTSENHVLQGTIFALHPALKNLQRWWNERQLLVLHAIASPYHERSHFDAQQLLESGGSQPFALQDGWLGRALNATGKSALALCPAMPLALRGSAHASTWTPGFLSTHDEDFSSRIAGLYKNDEPMANAWSHALAQQGLVRESGQSFMSPATRVNGFVSLARQAGAFLSSAQGSRVAWLETGGWDTHTQQANRLMRELTGLDNGLGALRESLGAHWIRTTVVVMTEFGRTAMINGSGGTDHGTGGVAFLAGGAVAGGQVLTDWPGLSSKQLLNGRDLRPTQDIRSLIAAVLQRQFGFSTVQLQAEVLPGAVSAERLGLWRS